MLLVKPKYLLLLLLIIFFLATFAFLPKSAFEGDLLFFKRWMLHMDTKGIGNIYNNRVEYNPVYLYLLRFFTFINGSYESAVANIYSLKMITLVFDIAGSILIFYYIKIKWNNFFLPFFALFNIAFLYNTIFWGQVDSIHTFFTVWTIILLLKGKLNWALVTLIFAINMKSQTIIFIPVIGLLWILQVIHEPKKLISLLYAAITQFILVVPFIFGGSVRGLISLQGKLDNLHPYLSMNAYNFWFLHSYPNNPAKILDSDLFFAGLSNKTIGFIMFFSVSIIIMIPFLKSCFLLLKKKILIENQFVQLTLLTAGMIAIVFFWFPTQMHERYVHPAMLFFFIYSVLSKKWWLYLLISFPYFLNLEAVLQTFQISSYSSIATNPKVIAMLYFYTLVLGTVHLYRHLDSLQSDGKQ